MTANRRRPARHAGFTLIESAIVLAVIGIVVAGIWVAAGVVTENSRASAAVQQLQQVSSDVRQYYQRVAAISTTGDVTAAMQTANIFPAAMLGGGTTPRGPWTNGTNGTVIVTAESASTYSITYNDLSRAACVNMLTRTTGGEVPGFASTQTNGAAAVTTKQTITSATNACNINGITNTIKWIFNLRG